MKQEAWDVKFARHTLNIIGQCCPLMLLSVLIVSLEQTTRINTTVLCVSDSYDFEPQCCCLYAYRHS